MDALASNLGLWFENEETRDARLLAEAYEYGNIDQSAQARNALGHAFAAVSSIPKLAWEVLAKSLADMAYACLWPLAGIAAVVALAEIGGLPFVGTAIAGLAMSMYRILTQVVITSLNLTAPYLVAGGVTLAVGAGVVHQLIDPKLPAAHAFHRHLLWIFDPVGASQADYLDCKKYQWTKLVRGAMIGAGVAALAVMASYRATNWHMTPRLHFR